MGISPMRQGQTLPWWYAPFLDDNNVAVNVSGAALSVVLVNLQTGAVQVGAGQMQINADNVSALYKWAAQDTAIPGQYEAFMAAVFPTGGINYSDSVPLEIDALTAIPLP